MTIRVTGASDDLIEEYRGNVKRRAAGWVVLGTDYATTGE